MDLVALTPAELTIMAARRLLAEANAEALALRRRVEVLAHATDWRSRATDAYRAAIGSLCDELAALIHHIDLADADLAEVLRWLGDVAR